MTNNHNEQTALSKHELEDHIDLLRELDKQRNKAAELRDKGLEAMKKWLVESRNVEGDVDLISKANANLNQAIVAVTLYDLSRNSNSEFLKKLKETIDGLCLFSPNDQEMHPLPVENAALNLNILVKAPNSAFSEKALCFFYHILREVYTADTPNWTIGGVRAAHGGHVSAYMTSLCLHALFDFAQAQENTTKFLGHIRSFLEQLILIVIMPPLNGWKKMEMERLRHCYHLMLAEQSRSITLCVDTLDPKMDFESYIVDGVLLKLVAAIKAIEDSFEKTINQHDVFRKNEKELMEGSEDKRKKFERSELGHNIAFAALRSGKEIASSALKELEEIGFEQAIQNLVEVGFLNVLKILESDDTLVEKNTIESIKTNLANVIQALKSLEKKFQETTHETRKSRFPVENFLKGVFDHQLAIAESRSNGTWEPSELASAAECLGMMYKQRQRWSEDKLLLRAAQELSKVISDRGLFPFSHPYHSSNNRGHLVPQSTIVYLFSELVRLLPKTSSNKIEPGVTARIINFFEDSFIERKPDFVKNSEQNNGQIEEGWCNEHAPHPRHAHPNYTTAAVLALASLNRMLDEWINSIILDHFTVKWPRDIELNLDELFYPDYGFELIEDLTDKSMAAMRERLNDEQIQILDKAGGFPTSCNRESVAITLQRARAHVLKANPDIVSKKPIHSLVLHGPPGTGKTTLIEALAKSCEVPMVEITPSDIVMGGMEAVERSARTVFEALSFLTRTVILFDEFDPVLWRRDPSGGTPNNVFSFLTPGMLPKLKNLHDKTKRRSVAYVLSTNLIGSLDDAAVRGGRFDEKIGIFPPDRISRTGRLYNQYYAFKRKAEREKVTIDFPPDDLLEQRIDYIVHKTQGGPMDKLGKPGWFTKPKLDKISESNKASISKKLTDIPFEYLIFGTTLKLDELEREATINGIVGEGKTAVKEWVQWYWVSQKDSEN